MNPTITSLRPDSKPNDFYAQYKFPNGYGASVVSHHYSYGGTDGLFEIALIDAATDELVYRDDFHGSDVGGYLTFAEIAEDLAFISALPPIQSVKTP